MAGIQCPSSKYAFDNFAEWRVCGVGLPPKEFWFSNKSCKAIAEFVLFSANLSADNREFDERKKKNKLTKATKALYNFFDYVDGSSQRQGKRIDSIIKAHHI